MREAKEPEKMQLRLQKLMIGAVRGCGPGGAAWLPQLHEWNLPKCCRAGHKTNVRIQLQPMIRIAHGIFLRRGRRHGPRVLP
jgi:hypothetical protein